MYGIKFASIQKDHAFLMYPARWFPVNDYTVDRYTATSHHGAPADTRCWRGTRFRSDQQRWEADLHLQVHAAEFPRKHCRGAGGAGPGLLRGRDDSLYFRDAKDMAQSVRRGDRQGLSYLTSVFGLPPQASLTLVETEAGTPNGYSSQGLIFLSPRAIGKQVNPRLLANQVARQWLGVLWCRRPHGTICGW